MLVALVFVVSRVCVCCTRTYIVHISVVCCTVSRSLCTPENSALWPPDPPPPPKPPHADRSASCHTKRTPGRSAHIVCGSGCHSGCRPGVGGEGVGYGGFFEHVMCTGATAHCATLLFGLMHFGACARAPHNNENDDVDVDGGGGGGGGASGFACRWFGACILLCHLSAHTRTHAHVSLQLHRAFKWKSISGGHSHSDCVHCGGHSRLHFGGPQHNAGRIVDDAPGPGLRAASPSACGVRACVFGCRQWLSGLQTHACGTYVHTNGVRNERTHTHEHAGTDARFAVIDRL